jgi:Transposase and inactivated derivatives, IS30 family
LTLHPNLITMSQHLTYEECVSIQAYLEIWWKHRAIARKLWRSNSSISDEVKKYSVNGVYVAKIAWCMRKAKRALLNVLYPRIEKWSTLDNFIVEKVKKYWSPEQIAKVWKMEHKEKLSTETVYRHIKFNHKELIKKYFRRKWHPYKYGTIKANYIYNRKSIHERPISAKNKTRFGHWEGDTMWWAKRIWGLVTFTERKSWYELAKVLKEKTAENVTKAVYELFNDLPKKLKRTITLDNGREFVEHRMWKCLVDIDTYFADVGNAGQRGLNENTNGLLRQFFPKWFDLANLQQEKLDYYLDLLNNRPRKRLGFLSPRQYLAKHHCAVLK